MSGWRRPLVLILTMLLAVPASMLAVPAKALEVTPFSQSADLQVHGDYIVAGNGVLTCGAGADCTSLLRGTGVINDEVKMVYTGPTSTMINSSSATLTIPAGAKVVRAKLMWSGSLGQSKADPTAYNVTMYNVPTTPIASCTPKFDYSRDVWGRYYYTNPTYPATPPSGEPATTRPTIVVNGVATSVPIERYSADLDQITRGNAGYYAASGDVLAALQSLPTGTAQTITVGNIWAPQGNNCYGGWALQVVYDYGAYVPGNNASVLREVYSYDGYVREFAGDPATTINLGGLKVQGNGAKAAVIGYEGDAGISGDYVSYSDPSTALYNLPNPQANGSANNMFVGYAEGAVKYPPQGGTATSGTFYNASVDARTVELPGLASGDTSLSLGLGTTQDSYLLQNVTVSVPMAEITILKTASNGEQDQAIKPGAQPSFRITVYNSGAVALLNMAVTDQLVPVCGRTPAQLDAEVRKQYPSGQIPPGGSVQYTCTAPPATTSYDNTAAVTGTTPNGLVVNNSGVSKVLVATWEVTKAAKYPDVPIGTNATWVVNVKNTGGADIYDVNVSDPQFSDCNRTVALVKAGETLSYECVGIVNARTNNTINATGTAKATQNASITVPMSAMGVTTPTYVEVSGVQLTKTADKALYNVGEAATFTFVVKNTGTSVLNSFTIDDPAFPTCNKSITTPLAPGASTTLTCTAVPYPTASSSPVTNTATVTGNPPSGFPVTSTSNVSMSNKSVTIAKSGTSTDRNGNGVLDAGDTVAYSFVLTNTGASPLTGVTVTDPLITGAITCPATTLAPGATMTCTAPAYTVTQANVDAGTLVNTATVRGTASDGSTTGGTASVTLTPVQNPAITLAKTASPQTVSAVGQNVTYTFVATNTGNTTLTGVTVADQLAGLSALSCKNAAGTAVAMPATLAPKAALTCTATRATTQADLDAGKVVNNATVAGTSPKGTVVNGAATATVTATQSPATVFTKSADVTQFTYVGQVVHYTFKTTNTGNVTLSSVAMNDPLQRIVNRVCSPTQPATLAPGASVTCTAELTVTQADLDAGSIVNTATMNANSPTGALPQKTSTWTITPSTTAALGFTKTASRSSITAPGQVVTYTFTATNNGTSTINNVQISDPRTGLGALSCTPALGSSLAPGARMTCTAAYTSTQADVDRGSIVNSATATGTDSHGVNLSQTAQATVTASQTSSITLGKSANPTTVTAAGQTVTYTFAVRNTGNTTLKNYQVTDTDLPGLSAITCAPIAMGADLAPGATTTCQATYATTPANMNAGTFTNAASVTAAAPVGNVSAGSSATVTATQSPSYTFTKTPSTTQVTAAGQTITYTMVVSNTGNVSLSNLTVSDPKVTGLTCAPVGLGGALAPGATTTCTGTHTVTQAEVNAGSVTNLASAALTPPNTTTPITRTAAAAVAATQTASLASTKTVDKTSFTAVGETLTYTIKSTNTGNTTLQGVTVTDPLFPGTSPLSCTPALPVANLDPNATITCTGTHRVTQAELDAGTIVNTATTSARSGSGAAVSATSTATSTAVQNPSFTLTKTPNPTSITSVGRQISYTLLFTNTGNVSYTGVTLSDAKLAGVTCTPAAGATIAPGATMSCTGTYTSTQADLDAGSITNTASASATRPGGVVENKAAAAVVTATQSPALSMTKTASPTRVNAVGQTINYTFVVTNSGNVTASAVAIADPMAGLSAITCPATTIDPGKTLTCTATKTVTQADLDAPNGKLPNTATVSARQPNGSAFPTAQASASVDVGQAPAQTLMKTADRASFSAVGDRITYTLTSRNSGNTTLTNVQVTDNLIANLACTPAAGSPLAPGEAMVCTGSRTVTQSDLDAGAIVNTASTTGVTPTGATLAPMTAKLPLPAVQSPSVTLTKTPNVGTVAKVGDTITYTYTARNTGNLTLGSLVIVDPHPGLAQVNCGGVSVLAPGATATCRATYTVTQADLNAGSIPDTATVRTESPRGNPGDPADDVTATASAVVAATQTPALTFIKSASQETYRTVGRVITYTFQLQNAGNVDLANVRVADPMPGLSAVRCNPAQGSTLAPNAIMTCNADYTTTQADIDARSITNTATATATPPSGTLSQTSTKTITAALQPSLTLSKAASPTQVSAVGQPVAYTFTVTNTGNTTLTNLGVTDPMPGLSAPVCQASTLAPQATTTCTASYAVTQADLDRGSIPNTAEASGTDPAGTVARATASQTVQVAQTPRLEMAKRASVESYSAVGTPITYTFTVTNRGNVTVNDIAITDPLPGLTGLSCPTRTLAPGASTDCTATYVTTQGNIDQGRITNTATVNGTTPTGAVVPPATATTTVNAVQTPASTFTKVADRAAVSAVGEVVTYTFRMTNTGNTTLGGVLFTDPRPGLSTLSCTVTNPATGARRPGSGAVSLAPGEYKECTANYPTRQADLDAGSLPNTATASSTLPDGSARAPMTASTTVTATQDARITFNKTSDTATYSRVGQVVNYTFTIINEGNVTLANPTITDPMSGLSALSCTPAGATTIAPKTTLRCTASRAITQADLDAQSVANTATATVTPPNGTPITQTSSRVITAVLAPSIGLAKSASPNPAARPGDVVTYSFVVTNTGNVTLHDVAVADPLPGLSPVSCPVTTLAPQASTTCTATMTLTQAQADAGSVANTARASGVDVAGTVVTKDASALLRITQTPTLTLDKVASVDTVARAGDTVTYSFTVANSGNVTVNDIVLTDPRLGAALTCPATTLSPGATMTCSLPYSVTQADVDAGSVTNTATVTGTTTSGAQVPQAQDSVTVTAPASPSWTLVKTADHSDVRRIGDTVVYTIRATNTGNVTLGNVFISDPRAADPTTGRLSDCWVENADGSWGSDASGAVSLLPGQSKVCRGNRTFVQADFEVPDPDPATAGIDWKNQATATATLPDGTVLPQLASSPAVGAPAGPTTVQLFPTPDFTMTKTADAQNYSRVGQVVNYTIDATNSGNVALTNVQVIDTKLANVAFSCTPAMGSTLQPGQTMTCSGAYAVTQADIDAGSITNSAAGRGTDAQGVTHDASAAAVLKVVYYGQTGIALEKSANPRTVTRAGEVVTYSFLVTNLGTGAVTGVSVTDPKPGLSAISCPSTTIAGTVDAASPSQMTCTATYTVTQADIDAKAINNNAAVHGETINGGQTVQLDATSSARVVANHAPSLTLAKTATPRDGSVDAVGDLIDYSFVVTNTGNLVENDIVVADPLPNLTRVSCPSTSLAPGASMTCTATATVSQAQLDQRTIANTATVSATDLKNPTPTTYATARATTATSQSPNFTFAKTVSAATIDRAGDQLTYTLTFANTGNVTLYGVSFTDAMLPRLAGFTCNMMATTILPGETRTCTATATALQADIDAGSIVNTATVRPTDPSGTALPAVSRTAVVDVLERAGLSLAKELDQASYSAVGQTLNYSFTLTNTGNVSLADVQLRDDLEGLQDTHCTPAMGTTLAGGATMTCTASYVVTQADLDQRSIVNRAHASGVTPPAMGGTLVESNQASRTATADLVPRLDLVKSDNKSVVTTAGEVIDYTFQVTNTGNATVHDLVVADAFTTRTNKASLPVTCPVTTLAPNEQTTCTASYAVTQSDIDTGEPREGVGLSNSATATAQDANGTAASDTATLNVLVEHKPHVVLTKTAGQATYSAVGEVVDYTVTMVNDGNVAIWIDEVADELVADLVCDKTFFEPGQTATCRGTYTITQSDLDAGRFTNTVTMAGADIDRSITVGAQGEVTITAAQTPAMTLAKIGSPVEVDTIGQTITYTLRAKNTGNVTLSNVYVADPLQGLSAFSCGAQTGPVSLAPGQVKECRATYSVKAADLDAGSLSNTATVTANGPTGSITPVTATWVTKAIQRPALTTVKQVDSATYGQVGQVLTYTITITNLGNTSVYNVGLTESLAGTSAPTCTPGLGGTLAAGASMTCRLTHTITQADIDARAITNVATATGTGPGGVPVSDPSDEVVSTATLTPGLSLTKTGTPSLVDHAGEEITFRFDVANTGNVALSNVVLTDLRPGVSAITCPSGNPADGTLTLAAGESIECTATYSVTLADIDGAEPLKGLGIGNSATVSARDTAGTPVTATADVMIGVNHLPGLSLVKTSDISTFSRVGELVTYTFVITNTGEVSMRDLVLHDPIPNLSTPTCTYKGAPVDLADAEFRLAPNEEVVCTATRLTGQSGLDVGFIQNTATVTGNDWDRSKSTQASSTNVITAEQRPEMTLEKTADKSVISTVGEEVTYTLVQTNTGNVTLTNTQIVDPAVVSRNFTVDFCTITAVDKTTRNGLGPQSLAPREFRTCQVTGATTQADLDAGSVSNTAGAIGSTINGPIPTVYSTWLLKAQTTPGIELVKTASPTRVQNAGDTVTYGFTVTNTGTSTLNGITLSDDMAGLSAITCDVDPATAQLAPKASLTCSATKVVSAAEMDEPTLVNSATVQALDPQGNAVSSSATARVIPVHQPRLALDKYHTDPDITAAGQTVTWHFTVRNVGNVVVDNIAVTDSLAGTSAVQCDATRLAVGASAACSTTYVVTQADVDRGMVSNTASVTGIDPVGGDAVTAGTDSDDWAVTQTSSLAITKTPLTPGPVALGQSVDFQIVVTNNGNTTVNGVVPSDSSASLTALTCNPGINASLVPNTSTDPANPTPGSTMTCRATVTVTQADFDARRLTNEAAVDGQAPNGTPVPRVTASADIATTTGTAAITLDKTADVANVSNVGDRIVYTFTGTNTGDYSIRDWTMTDPMPRLSTLACDHGPSDTIAPDEVVTCTADYVVTQADLDRGHVANTALWSTHAAPDQAVLEATDSLDIPVLSTPELTLTKRVDQGQVTAAGDPLRYTMTVLNSGNVTVANIGITDTMQGLSAYTCVNADGSAASLPATLAPQASITCQADYVARQADIDAGSIVNRATAAGVTTSATPQAVASRAAAAVVGVEQNPAVRVTKTANTALVQKVGDKIEYTITATNTGNVTLSDARLVDPMPFDSFTCTPAAGSALAPGQAMSCTGVYSVTHPDLVRSGVTNLASFTAIDPTGEGVEGDAALTVAALYHPKMEFTKTVKAPENWVAGDTITYEFHVANVGNMTAYNVLGVDSMADMSSLRCWAPGVVANPDGTYTLVPFGGAEVIPGSAPMEPGQFVDCRSTYVVKQTDVDRGRINNTAVLNAYEATGERFPTEVASATTTTVHAPSMEIAKRADVETVSTTSDVIRYSFDVTNTGATTLSGVQITDSKPGLSAISCPSTSVAPGATLTCTATYRVTQANLDAGVVENRMSVTARDPFATVVGPQYAQVVTPATQRPALAVEKSAGTSMVTSAGQVIDFTITTTNTGNVTAHDVTVTDANATAVITSCDRPAPVVLAPGERVTCQVRYTVTLAEMNGGGVHNVAHADAHTLLDLPFPQATGTADVPAQQAPDVEFTKVADKSTYQTLGEVVTYTMTARNTGNVSLANVRITDPAPGLGAFNCTPALGSSVDPGDAMVCTVTHAVSQADLDLGQLRNTATYRATPPAGPDLTGTSSVFLRGVMTPRLSLVKSADRASVSSLADVITYSFLVKNTGNVTLHDVVVSDPLTGQGMSPISCPSAVLAPGAEVTCTATFRPQQIDLDRGYIPNTATANGTDPANNPAERGVGSVRVAVSQHPDYEITKQADHVLVTSAGEQVLYTIIGMNTGNVTLSVVQITDPMFPRLLTGDQQLEPNSLDCYPRLPAEVPPGQRVICRGLHTVTQAELNGYSLDNTAAINGRAPDGTVLPEKQATETIRTVVNAELGIDKVADVSQVTAIGDPINYTFTLTNHSNVDARDIRFRDPMFEGGAGVTCNLDGQGFIPYADGWTLSPQEGVECRATYLATVADFDRGHVPNTATFDANQPNGTPIAQASDVADVLAIPSPSMTITDTPDVASFNAVGQRVRFTYRVQNTGNVTIHDLVVRTGLALPPGAQMVCEQPMDVLAPGATAVCYVDYVVTQADLDAGGIKDNVTADGTTSVYPGDGRPGIEVPLQTVVATAAVPAVTDPKVTLAKTANPGTVSAVGQPVEYTFTLANEGNVTASNVTIADPMPGLSALRCTVPGTAAAPTPTPSPVDPSVTPSASPTATPTTPTPMDPEPVEVTLPMAEMAPGVVVTCTATRAATQADLDAGSVVNTARASATAPGGAQLYSLPASAVVDTVTTASMAVAKSGELADADGNGKASTGELVTYDVVVTNTGSVTLTNTRVDDPMFQSMSCAPAAPAALAPGASMRCVGTHAVTAAEAASGSLTNTATATSDQVGAAGMSASSTMSAGDPPPAPAPAVPPRLPRTGAADSAPAPMPARPGLVRRATMATKRRTTTEEKH